MRKALLLITILLALGGPVFASLYLRGSVGADYMTNVYSDPLPQNGDEEYRENAEFIKRVNLNVSVTGDLFFHDWDPAGLSMKLGLNFPVYSRTQTVDDPSSDDWAYVESDSLDDQDVNLTLGVGPVFRYMAGHVDIALALRLGVGTFDLFDTITLGLQADVFVNVFLSENWFISAGLLYDAALIRFTYSSDTSYYEEDFSRLTVGGFVGGGYRFGGRR